MSAILSSYPKVMTPVVRKVGTVNYVIDMHDTRKRERTFHTNMHKKWNTPSQDCYSMMVDGDGLWEEEGDGDIPVWNDKESGEPILRE